MKFTHQIKFNSVPEWRDHYIHYAALKKTIYAIAKAEAHEHVGDEEALGHPLLFEKVEVTEESLKRQLDRELADIISFYLAKEAELLSKMESLDLEVHSMEKMPRTLSTALSETLPSQTLEPRDSQAADMAAPTPPESAPQVSIQLGHESPGRSQRIEYWSKPPRAVVKERDRLRQRFHDLYVSLHDLINFLTINREGFRKILKKHDKLTSSNMKDAYWPIVELKFPLSHKEVLERALARLCEEYAVVYLHGDMQRAKDQLSKMLREQLKVERNTVWRDMVAMERRAHSAVVQRPVPKKAQWLARYGNYVWLLIAVGVFVTLLWSEVFKEEEKNNCLALLAFVSVLWATEAIPLFATSMLVPVLVVLLRVLVDRSHDPPTRLEPQQAAPAIFHAMFSQVIMLLLGGFAIAGALSKHFIAKQMAIAVLSRVGRKPHNVLLASMFVATFASMWISNVAAPVLCFSLVQPILRTLDVQNKFARSLVMGIALASNVGGMTSPISSPQNIFAIERMSMDGDPPSWLSWFAVALPVSVICIFICWGILLVAYQPWRQLNEVRPLKPNTDPMTKTQVYVIVVSIVTVGLWCANSGLQRYTGEMGIVAILPLVAFFGFGVLNKDDFNGFLWNVVMLAMGGLALGEAVKSSGLLLSIATAIQDLVAGMDLWQVCAIFCALILVCTTFISHTVGAMVILPLVQSVGEQMPDPHPKLLVMASALMCSGAMGLPVSGFPNMNAVALEDNTGQNYVNSVDFLKVGIVSSVAAYAVIVSLGYLLMFLVKF